MPTEIERKFLVADASWRDQAGVPQRLRQGYLALTERAVVRVRIAGRSAAWIGVKEHKIGRSHGEFEYPIPPPEARELLRLCSGNLVEKQRFRVPVAGHEWEIDEFLGANAGLVLAELELRREDESFAVPHWLGREVTTERRFYNAALSVRPWRSWPAAERK